MGSIGEYIKWQITWKCKDGICESMSVKNYLDAVEKAREVAKEPNIKSVRVEQVRTQYVTIETIEG